MCSQCSNIGRIRVSWNSVLECTEGLHLQSNSIVINVPEEYQPSAALHMKVLKTSPMDRLPNSRHFQPINPHKKTSARWNIHEHVTYDMWWCSWPRTKLDLWSSANQNYSGTPISIILGSSMIRLARRNIRLLRHLSLKAPWSWKANSSLFSGTDEEKTHPTSTHSCPKANPSSPFVAINPVMLVPRTYQLFSVVVPTPQMLPLQMKIRSSHYFHRCSSCLTGLSWSVTKLSATSTWTSYLTLSHHHRNLTSYRLSTRYLQFNM